MNCYYNYQAIDLGHTKLSARWTICVAGYVHGYGFMLKTVCGMLAKIKRRGVRNEEEKEMIFNFVSCWHISAKASKNDTTHLFGMEAKTWNGNCFALRRENREEFAHNKEISDANINGFECDAYGLSVFDADCNDWEQKRCVFVDLEPNEKKTRRDIQICVTAGRLPIDLIAIVQR